MKVSFAGMVLLIVLLLALSTNDKFSQMFVGILWLIIIAFLLLNYKQIRNVLLTKGATS